MVQASAAPTSVQCGAFLPEAVTQIQSDEYEIPRPCAFSSMRGFFPSESEEALVSVTPTGMCLQLLGSVTFLAEKPNDVTERQHLGLIHKT